ncbi:rhomboid-related protein 4-like [Hetaerina americana]|uniref:rhomboid-related protein 4-like n=1 Tax=Hetaerina americana TaxID=62018 RepID=UPI003A7F4539
MSERRRGPGLGVLLLCYEVASIGFSQIPPVTLIAVVGQALLYSGYISVPWDRWDVCVSAENILNGKEYSRLFLSAVEHGSDMHLYYNMISFISKARGLEQDMFGSCNFAVFLLLMTLLCSVTYVALSAILFRVLHDYAYMKTCAIGFSGVVFALKALTTKREDAVNPGGRLREIDGSLNLPFQNTVWSELILIYFLVPGSSFVGHLAGILAGMAYIHTPVGDLVDHIIAMVTGERLYRWSYLMGYT